MTIQNKNDQMMLALLRSAVWGEQRYPFRMEKTADWAEIYNELRMQTVDALPAEMMGRVSVDKDIYSLFFQSAALNVSVWYTLMQEQQQLYELFQEHDIPFVILKGAAAAIYYPDPVYRTMGDIDLIVEPSDYERALQCMQNHGYEADRLRDRHAELRKNGIEFELHRYFSTFNQKEYLDLLDGMIFDAIARAKRAEIEGFVFPMLPTLENGLVLLEHINVHIEMGLGLRQIMDWMMYVDRELNDEYYEKAFQPVIRRLDLEKLAVTVTRMCQLYLGLSEEITWCQEAEEDLCHILMEVTLKSGNFGHKKTEDDYAVSYLHYRKNPIQALLLLQRRGCYTWKALEKYPILKCFAWLYQICRLIKKGFSRKQPLRSLVRNTKESRRQEDFMDRLGVARRNKGIVTPCDKK